MGINSTEQHEEIKLQMETRQNTEPQHTEDYNFLSSKI